MSLDSFDEEAIFDQAIQIGDRQARADFLDKACDGDAALRASLEELLACHDTAGDYLETSPLRPSEAWRHESSGDRIDRYELSERIGEGGFGVVYRALQLAPIRRNVALKIIRLGMDSEEVVRRFEVERQVMSMMSHPHIAAVLDAGTTKSGRPYFAMEFVDGESIDEFCDRQQLSVPKVLNLFLDVCLAIQHAHQKGVVHRDLKPSNVIVVAGDCRPIPKVIDFGIAKALTPQPGEQFQRTVEHRILGTPGYMSPEQIAHDKDIDTRADVYALGGILYRLLVGVEPFDTKSLRKLGLADAYQQISNQPIMRPSLRLRTLEKQQQQEIALRRQSQSALLRRTLAGDLDWIIMRALEKERERRYGTVQELTADIQRFLRHEPVSAGPPTIRYRLRKLVRRNWIATVASALVAASIVTGGTAATIGFVRAQRESQRAKAEWLRAEEQRRQAAMEARKAEQTLKLLEQMIGASHPDQGHAADYTLRQLLNDFADSFDAGAFGQPEIAARLHRTIGRAYWSLGDMARAGEHLSRSLKLCSEQYGDDHPLTAETRVDYALYLMRMSRVIEAQQTLQRGLEVLRQQPANEQTVWALFVLSRVHHELNEQAKSLEYIKQARDVARGALGSQHPLAISMRMRASLKLVKASEADQESQAALNDILTVRPANHMDVADAKRQRATVLVRLRRFSEAETHVREAMDVHQRLLGSENSNLAHDMIILTRVLHRSGRHEDAIQQARQARDLAERVTIERDILRFKAYQGLAMLLEPVAPSEAIDVWEKAIQAKQQVVGQHVDVAKLLHRQAGLFVRLEKRTEAAECYRRSLKTAQESTAAELARGMGGAASHEFVEAVYFAAAVDLLETLIELDRLDEARALADQIRLRAKNVEFTLAAAVAHIAAARMSLAEGDLHAAKESINASFAKLGNSPHLAIRVRAILVEGEILTELKEFKEAQRKLARAYRTLRRRQSMPDHFEYAVARQLAILFERRNFPIKAAAWKQRASSIGESAGE